MDDIAVCLAHIQLSTECSWISLKFLLYTMTRLNFTYQTHSACKNDFKQCGVYMQRCVFAFMSLIRVSSYLTVNNMTQQDKVEEKNMVPPHPPKRKTICKYSLGYLQAKKNLVTCRVISYLNQANTYHAMCKREKKIMQDWWNSWREIRGKGLIECGSNVLKQKVFSIQSHLKTKLFSLLWQNAYLRSEKGFTKGHNTSCTWWIKNC